MTFIFWNIRGMANRSSRETLFSYYKQISSNVICLAELMMNPDEFSINLLCSLNMKLIALNSLDGCSKILIVFSNNIQIPIVVSNSDQEITLDFDSAPRSYRGLLFMQAFLF